MLALATVKRNATTNLKHIDKTLQDMRKITHPKTIEITLEVEPTAKGRPRTAFLNGKVHTYNPERTMIAQNLIVACLAQYKDQCFAPHVPVRMMVTFYRTKPRWLKQSETMPVRKPDLNNFLGLLLDGINKMLWDDDAQLTTCLMSKRWSPTDKSYIKVLLTEDSL